jgi:hypothetical protein
VCTDQTTELRTGKTKPDRTKEEIDNFIFIIGIFNILFSTTSSMRQKISKVVELPPPSADRINKALREHSTRQQRKQLQVSMEHISQSITSWGIRHTGELVAHACDTEIRSIAAQASLGKKRPYLQNNWSTEFKSQYCQKNFFKE